MKRAGDYWVPDAEELQIEALSQGGWQIDHLDTALAHVTDWSRAIDGGAHVGSWTLRMAERFQSVLAFEPAPDTYECLQRNIGEWRAAHMNSPAKIATYQSALGQAVGTAGMATDEKYHGGNTGGRYIAPGHDIKLMTIDSLMLGQLGFLKLDVEGYELFALHGAAQTLLRCRPVVMIEDKIRMAARYGIPPHAAANYLASIGMERLGAVGADIFFGWPK